ncbi:uncharacterized protein LOC114542435, partial [Dendronephthya gigantea]
MSDQSSEQSDHDSIGNESISNEHTDDESIVPDDSVKESEMSVIFRGILEQQMAMNEKLDKQKEENDRMRDTLGGLSKSVVAIEQRLKQFEEKNNTSVKRSRKAKVPADIKSTVRTIIKQKEDQDGLETFDVEE